MIGAAVGMDKIPLVMRNKVLKFDCAVDGNPRQRPAFLSTKQHLMNNMNALLAMRPKNQYVYTFLR